MKQDKIKIGSHMIGEGEPTYIVAEMSANHLQDYDRAEAIIRAAKEAGADAVKPVSYTPLTTPAEKRGAEMSGRAGCQKNEE